jgi:hypothetical protein
MILLLLTLLQTLNINCYAETTRDLNEETQIDRRYLPTYTWRGAPQLNAHISKEVSYLRGLNKGMKYAYINKKTGKGGFATYLVELSSGKIIDTFPSLIGYNGMGCGKGQTRPGVTKLTRYMGTGASRKKWWGNNWRYYDIEPISGVTKCKINTQIVTHSNKNLSGKSINDRISSHSSGCFTVPPDRLDQMRKYAGDAYIYNVP